MKLIKLLAPALLLFGCGTSPGDAYQELERQIYHTDEWCGWKAPDPQTIDVVEVIDHSGETTEVDKVFNHPDGFGITATFGCFEADETWPGGFCFAPGTRVVKTQLHLDGQDSTWFKKSTDEFGAWRDRLNGLGGWDVTRTTGSPAPTMNVHTDSTTSTSGVLAESLQNTWTLHTGFAQGDYWTYAKCDVKAYRLRIEANPAYQAASATQKDKWLKNMWDHEYSHCSGLAHTDTEDLLMSLTYYFPGPRYNSNLNPTTAEINMLDTFSPLD